VTNRLLATLLTVLATCPLLAQSPAKHETAVSSAKIDGAGSPIIYPLFSAWIDEYCRLHPGVRIEYQAIGSGGGIRQLLSRTTVFAASDGPMTDDQLAQAKSRIVHFPVTLNAVVPVYNLAQVPELRFSGSTLADIFLGKITRWDDPAIASDNPGVNLPKMDIKVVHHFATGAEGAYLMADYLSKRSSAFKTTFASRSTTTWPVANGMAGAMGAVVAVWLESLGRLPAPWDALNSSGHVRISSNSPL